MFFSEDSLQGGRTEASEAKVKRDTVGKQKKEIFASELFVQEEKKMPSTPFTRRVNDRIGRAFASCKFGH